MSTWWFLLFTCNTHTVATYDWHPLLRLLCSSLDQTKALAVLQGRQKLLFQHAATGIMPGEEQQRETCPGTGQAMFILFGALNGQDQLLHTANRGTFNARDEEEELLLLRQCELTDDILQHSP